MANNSIEYQDQYIPDDQELAEEPESTEDQEDEEEEEEEEEDYFD